MVRRPMSTAAVRSGALIFAVASLLIATPVTTAAAPARAYFDTDHFSLSSSEGSASGAVRWSRSEGGRLISGRLSGSVDTEGSCLQVSWLNSANRKIGGGAACGGDFGMSFSSSSLDCVLVRLGDSGRQMCAGGS